MSLQLICGRSGTGKTTYIFNEITRLISDGKKKYIITPEQFSFTAEKELLKNIQKNANSKAVINSEVLTFDRMAHRVASEVGGTTKTAISNSGKSMLIYSILSNKKNNLKFLGKSDNNVNVILKQLTELKKHGVSLEDLKELMDKVEKNKYLYEKLNDICTVYNEYESKIQDEYIDENDSLTVLLRQLDRTNMFKNCEIYIDEFVGFTKQEYLIIEKLMKVADKVTVTICSDNIEKSENLDTDVFYSNKQTANNILKIAKANEITIEQDVYLQENKRAKSSELKHIEENIFKVPYTIYNDDAKNIKLFLANNQYSEIENLAKQIIKLVRDEGYKYKEISVITQNIDTYSSICKAIFNKYGIPVYIDQKGDLNDNIIVKYIIAILDIFAKNWTADSVFQYIKTGFTNLSYEDIFLLEKYATKWNIKGNKWYNDKWQFHDEDDFGKENIDKINMIKDEIVEPLVDLRKKLSGIKTAKQISENIYNFLIKNEIDKKLDEKILKLNELGELNLIAEYETSWKIIMQVLDEVVIVFGEDKITFENYMQVLKTGFGNSELGTIPMSQDQVVIGDVDRSRSHKVRAVFIIGLNDGSFPAVNKAEGFLNDSDRDTVKQYGIELAKGTLERIYEDNFNIYKALTTPEEKLFLSYASSDSDGKPLRNSILVSKLRKMFPQMKEESDIVNRKSEIIGENSTFDELLINLRKFRDGEEIERKWFNVYNIYSEDDKWKSKLENAIKALDYSNNPDRITEENIYRMYGNTMQTSVSKLEQYRSCPFSYYLKYGLKLNDKDEFKIEAIDTGKFMHEIIDTFFAELDDRKISVKEIEDAKLEKIVSEIVNKKLQLNKNYIFNTTAKYRNLANRLKKVVTTSIKFIVQSLKQSDFEILGNEVEFGSNGKYKAIEVSTDSGKNVKITGKIDRIDIAKNPDGTYVRIIDYKSSIKNVDLNKVVAGLQLQLLTYLNETCKVEDFLPAGVLYFNLSDPNIKTNSNISDEEIENAIKRKFKMQGLILADVNVIKMMDNKIEETGNSEIIPAGIKKDGEINSYTTKGLTSEQFNNLQKYMDTIIKQISKEILSGNIDIKPYYNTKTQKGKTPCEYCKYKSICRFDVNNIGNTYRYIENLNKDAVLEKIKNME